MTNEQLIEKAKIDYPVGTVFEPAYVQDGKCIVTEDSYFEVRSGNLVSVLPDGRVWNIDNNSSYGDNRYNRIIWDQSLNIWAKIISKPEVKDNFEVGKWYKCKWTINNQEIFIKPTEVSISNVACNGPNSLWFYDNIYQIHNGAHYVPNALEIIEQLKDTTEIQQYLPNGHPDKIKVPEIPPYKVGDWVITKGYGQTYDGRALKIVRIEDAQFCYFEVNDDGFHVKSDNFFIHDIVRKATEEEISMKSKEDLTGRYLKALVDNPQAIGMKAGDYLLLQDNYGSNVIRVKDNTPGFTVNLDKIGKYYELMPKGFNPSDETKWIPAIGDWCYIIDNGTSYLQKGQVYRLNNINLANPKQKHHFDKDGKDYKDNSCWLSEDEFRKAEAHEIPGNNTPYKYKVGDWVVILSAIDDTVRPYKYACNSLSFFQENIGKAFKITRCHEKAGGASEDGVFWIKVDETKGGITSNQIRLATGSEVHHTNQNKELENCDRVRLKLKKIDPIDFTGTYYPVTSEESHEKKEFRFVEPIIISTEKKKKKKVNLSIQLIN